jgi:hypothetical protein
MSFQRRQKEDKRKKKEKEKDDESPRAGEGGTESHTQQPRDVPPFD